MWPLRTREEYVIICNNDLLFHLRDSDLFFRLLKGINLFKPLERYTNYSSKSVLSAPKKVISNTEGVEGRGGGRDDRRRDGRHTSPSRGLCTLKGSSFTLQGASIDLRRHFQSLAGPITTKDPHHKMRAYKPTKCTLAKKKNLERILDMVIFNYCAYPRAK